jgi:hypothetical protein
MKKESGKKLHLGKIKIARLSTSKEVVLNKDANAPTYTGCSLFKCVPPPDGRN